MGFYVVEFADETIAVVPACWVENVGSQNICKWPDHLRKVPSKLKFFIRESQAPTDDFAQYPIQILKIFENLEKAEQCAKKMEKQGTVSQTSDLSSLGRGKRNLKKRKRRILEDSGESDTGSDLTSISENLFINRRKRENVSPNLSQHLSPSIKPRTKPTKNQRIQKQSKVQSNIANNPTFVTAPLRENSEINRLLSPIMEARTEYRELQVNSATKPTRNNIFIPTYQSTPLAEFSEVGLSNNVSPSTSSDELVVNSVPTNPTINDVMKCQIEILEKLNHLGKLFNEHLKSQRTANSELPKELNIQLPVQNLRDFFRLDEFLSNNDNFNAMILYLKRYGTQNILQATKFMLQEVISDETASNFNYFGKKPKRKFYGCNVDKLIFYTVRSVSGSNKDEYRQAVMKWLKYAPQRLKYNNIRKEREEAENY